MHAKYIAAPRPVPAWSGLDQFVATVELYVARVRRWRETGGARCRRNGWATA